MFENKKFKTIIFWLITQQPFYEKLCFHVFRYFDSLWCKLHHDFFEKNSVHSKRKRQKFFKFIQDTSQKKYTHLHKIKIIEPTLIQKAQPDGTILEYFLIEDYVYVSVLYIFLVYCQIRNQIFLQDCSLIKIDKIDITSFIRQFIKQIVSHESFKFVQFFFIVDFVFF